MNSYDFLKYMTVHMEGTYDIDMLSEKMECSATGFYVMLNINGDTVPVIVTAKHFANKAAMVTFTLHYTENNNIVTLPITMPIQWITLENKDIACCRLDPIEDKFKKITGHSMFYTAIKENDIVSEYESLNINVLNEVIMLGYPKGKGSTHHKYPLFKKGYLASSPENFCEDNIGYVDISSISGYSGSPLILNNSTLKLVGVLVQTLSEKDQNIPADMGIYVNAESILEFKDRGDEVKVNPLTYKEFYDAYEDDKHRVWQEYFTYGGIPFGITRLIVFPLFGLNGMLATLIFSFFIGGAIGGVILIWRLLVPLYYIPFNRCSLCGSKDLIGLQP